MSGMHANAMHYPPKKGCPALVLDLQHCPAHCHCRTNTQVTKRQQCHDHEGKDGNCQVCSHEQTVCCLVQILPQGWTNNDLSPVSCLFTITIFSSLLSRHLWRLCDDLKTLLVNCIRLSMAMEKKKTGHDNMTFVNKKIIHRAWK